MNCEQVSEHISAYLDGELPGELVTAVRAHLDDCPVCLAVERDLRALRGLLGGLSNRPAPERLAADVLKEVERRTIGQAAPGPAADRRRIERALPPERRTLWPRALAMAATLLVATGLGVLAYLGMPGGPGSATLPDSRVAHLDRASKADHDDYRTPGDTAETGSAWDQSFVAGDRVDRDARFLWGGAPSEDERYEKVGGKSLAGDTLAYSDPARAAAAREKAAGAGGSADVDGSGPSLTLTNGQTAAAWVGESGKLGSHATDAYASKDRLSDAAATATGLGAAKGSAGPLAAGAPERWPQALLLETDSRERARADLTALFNANRLEPAEAVGSPEEAEAAVAKFRERSDERRPGEGQTPTGLYWTVHQADEDAYYVMADRQEVQRLLQKLAAIGYLAGENGARKVLVVTGGDVRKRLAPHEPAEMPLSEDRLRTAQAGEATGRRATVMSKDTEAAEAAPSARPESVMTQDELEVATDLKAQHAEGTALVRGKIGRAQSLAAPAEKPASEFRATTPAAPSEPKSAEPGAEVRSTAAPEVRLAERGDAAGVAAKETVHGEPGGAQATPRAADWEAFAERARTAGRVILVIRVFEPKARIATELLKVQEARPQASEPAKSEANE